MYIHFLLRKKYNDIVPNIINSGSVIPKVEFRIILGSKANNTEPNIAYCFLKNPYVIPPGFLSHERNSLKIRGLGIGRRYPEKIDFSN